MNCFQWISDLEIDLRLFDKKKNRWITKLNMLLSM